MSNNYNNRKSHYRSNEQNIQMNALMREKEALRVRRALNEVLEELEEMEEMDWLKSYAPEPEPEHWIVNEDQRMDGRLVAGCFDPGRWVSVTPIYYA